MAQQQRDAERLDQHQRKWAAIEKAREVQEAQIYNRATYGSRADSPAMKAKLEMQQQARVAPNTTGKIKSSNTSQKRGSFFGLYSGNSSSNASTPISSMSSRPSSAPRERNASPSIDSANAGLPKRKMGRMSIIESSIQGMYRPAKEEKSNILADIKEVYSEAKGLGYDPKIMRKVLIIRKMDIDERLEQEALLDTYRNALGIF